MQAGPWAQRGRCAGSSGSGMRAKATVGDVSHGALLEPGWHHTCRQAHRLPGRPVPPDSPPAHSLMSEIAGKARQDGVGRGRVRLSDSLVCMHGTGRDGCTGESASLCEAFTGGGPVAAAQAQTGWGTVYRLRVRDCSVLPSRSTAASLRLLSPSRAALALSSPLLAPRPRSRARLGAARRRRLCHSACQYIAGRLGQPPAAFCGALGRWTAVQQSLRVAA